jgi:hypothetical protein
MLRKEVNGLLSKVLAVLEVINVLSRFHKLQESVGPDANFFLGSIYCQICHVNNILDRGGLAVHKKRIRDLVFAVFDYQRLRQ